ncbi:MAG: hypothetical protein FJ000_00175 [Actinobacteria bacterium]|nr:hypothetical protein [Actinomycetota bacterium]
MTPDSDERLKAALDGLDAREVPAPAPDFDATVARRLAEGGSDRWTDMCEADEHETRRGLGVRRVLLLAAALILIPTAAVLALTSPWQGQKGMPTSVNPLPVYEDLHAVDFVDDEQGWAVGDAGTILSTVDGGATWQRRGFDITRSYADVDFLDERHGWVVGRSGGPFDSRPLMLRTSDGGKTWTAVRVNQKLYGSIGQIELLGDGHGFAIGSLRDKPGPIEISIGGGLHEPFLSCDVLETRDGGITWTPRLIAGGDRSVSHISFSDARNGWLACFDPYARRGSVLLRTHDGGRTWREVTGPTDDEPVSDPGSDEIRALAAHGDGGLWLTGSEGTWRTGDGGETWSSVRGLPADVRYTAISLDGDDRAWIAGCAQPRHRKSKVVILGSSDGGGTWRRSAFPTSDLIWSVSLCSRDGDRAWAVGSLGFMARTESDETWERAGVPPGWKPLPPALILAADFVDPTHGWAVGKRTVWQTSNGRDWDVLKAPRLTFWDVDFVTRSDGWALTFSPPLQRFVVAASRDGGRTWSTIRTNLRRQIANDLYRLDERRAWLCGNRKNRAYVMRTLDGGASWRYVPAVGVGFRLVDLEQVVFFDKRRGVAAAQRGAHSDNGTANPLPALLVRTSDGGRTWSEVLSAEGARIAATSLAFADRRHGWAAGFRGVWRTTDGGATWVRTATWPRYTDGEVRCVDSDHAWILTTSRGGPRDTAWQGILFTDDGDSTWARRPLGSGQWWTAFVPRGPRACVLFGPGGVVAEMTAAAMRDDP